MRRGESGSARPGSGGTEMVDDYAGAVAVIVVLPNHPAVQCLAIIHMGLDVAGDDPAIDLAVGGHRAGRPRVAADLPYIAESDVLVGGEEDAVVAAATNVDPAPGQRRVVDLVGGVRRVLLRVLVALLGGGVAVVQIAGARVVTAGVGRALVLHVLRDGLDRDLVRLRQQRLTRLPSTTTRRDRVGQRPVQLRDQDLAVPDVLSVSVAGAAAVKGKRPSAGVHHLVQIEADLPRLAAAAAGERKHF